MIKKTNYLLMIFWLAFILGFGPQDLYGEFSDTNNPSDCFDIEDSLNFEDLDNAPLVATITVINTNDIGAGSLRQAMTDANGTAVADVIEFNIPGAGVHTITPATPLPTMTKPVFIDGSTQPGYASTPLIEIDATNVAAWGSGIYFANNSDSGIKALCINRAQNRGVYMVNGTNMTVEDCIIGMDPTGLIPLGNAGIGVSFTGDGIVVSGCVITNNGGGQFQNVSGQNIELTDNIVGLNITGTIAYPTATTSKHGIEVRAADNVLIQGNIVSGNTGHGMFLSGAGTNLEVLNNKVGTDITGDIDLGNDVDGIQVSVYTPVDIFDNVIGGSGRYGILAANNNFSFLRNRVGIGVSGTDIGNDQDGVYLQDQTTHIFTNSQVGDGTIANANFIAYNGKTSVNSDGIAVRKLGTNRIPINTNIIHSNAGLGIDLQINGVTSNDAGDGDAGANDFLNFPVINSAIIGSLIIDFDLDVPVGDYRMEVYGIPSGQGDGSGHGEGNTYLGTFNINHTGSGAENFVETLAGTIAINAGDEISMTTTLCTDATCTTYEVTSEFSESMMVTEIDPCDATASGNTDSDGDGVSDICDLDNDNDGILDTLECGIPVSMAMTSGTAAGAGSQLATLSSNGTTANITITTTGGLFTITANSSHVSIDETSAGNGTYTFTSDVHLNNVRFSIFSLGNDLPDVVSYGNFTVVFDDASSMSGVDFILEDELAYSGFLDLAEKEYIAGIPYVVDSNDGTPSGQNQTQALLTLQGLPIDKKITSVSFDHVGGGVGVQTFFSLQATICDYDGDGIPNNVDLDSDNDGCADALEGGGTFTTANIQNDTLTGGVDADGIPKVATSSGQTVGDAQDDSEQSCPCPYASGIDTDNDGIDNTCDLDIDNDGILNTDECEGFLETPQSTTYGHYIQLHPSILGVSPNSTNVNIKVDISDTFSLAPGSIIVEVINGLTHATLDRWMVMKDVEDSTDFIFTGTNPVFMYGVHGNSLQAGASDGMVALDNVDYTFMNSSIQTGFTHTNVDDRYWVTNTTAASSATTIRWLSDGFANDIRFFTTSTGVSAIYPCLLPASPPPCDDDGDGVNNDVDLDSDNDGIPDLVEAGGTDTNGDGLIDYPIDGDPTSMVDIDEDGLADTYDEEDTAGSTPGWVNGDPIPNPDSDGDGILDALDLDADNDGIPDVIEAGGTDVDGDGIADGFVDTDGDGFNDTVDGDIDNDGAENTASALIVTGADTDTDGVPNTYPNGDTDGDGNLDHLDLDADGDGLTDLVEAGGVDSNGDGLVDTPTDADGDGFADVYDPNDDGSPGIDPGEDTAPLVETDGSGNLLNGETGESLDTDGDGFPDHLDLDADGDGLTDIVEAGGVDTDGDGLVDDPTDADNDGLADIYDTDDDGTPGVEDATDALLQTGGIDTDNDGKADDPAIVFADGEGNPADTDGDGHPDHLDLDADNDGLTDIVEAGGVDTDGDGLVDDPTDADNDGLADIYDTDDDGTPGVEDATDALLQTGGTDTDNDGKADDPAIVFADGEGNPADTDGDGHPDHLDLDADNDGLTDLVEAGGVDTDGDGLVDDPTDADNDGLADIYDTDDDGTPGVEDATDALLQTGGTDTDSDGKADDPAIVFADGDGYPADTDGDGYPDHLDLDADGDGLPDLVEAGGVDTDGDGLVDTPTDADNDGLADIYDTDDDGTSGVEDATDALLQTGGTDTDNDGKADDPAITFADGEGNPADHDGDGNLDHLDLDADNDGIPDVVEAGGIDTDGDGQVDLSTDTDGDGLADLYDTDDNTVAGTGDGGVALVETDGSGNMLDGTTGSSLDTDSDGNPDHLDIDADNDGITDIIEVGGDDTDGDGMVDTGISPWDIDGDGLADVYDTDNNSTPGTGDGATDALVITSADSNGDGHVDGAEVMEAGGAGTLASINEDGTDEIGGIPSLPNHLDIDADNDGIVDNSEAQATDSYIEPTGYDDDGDGLDNAYDSDCTGACTNIDGATMDVTGVPMVLENTDMTGLPDWLDLDSDNDGINDIDEAGGGVDPGATPEDLDGDGLIWDDATAGAGASDDPTNSNDRPSIFDDEDDPGVDQDWRQGDCILCKVVYGVQDGAGVQTTFYEVNTTTGLLEITANNYGIIRTNKYCLIGGWRYYYNPASPTQALFAMRGDVADLNKLEYIDITVGQNATDREAGVAATTYSRLMNRDWFVKMESPQVNPIDIRFYYPGDDFGANGFQAADAAADTYSLTDMPDIKWFKVPNWDSFDPTTISADATNLTNMTDFLVLTPVADADNTSGNSEADGDGTTVGNGKNYVQFDGLASFSGGTAGYGVGASALPVELTNFFSTTNGCNIDLAWVVENEVNFSHYELQWSGDGKGFQSIEIINGSGLGNKSQSYIVKDDKVADINYYRLKLVDLDDAVTYSQVIQANTDCIENTPIKLFPNPVVQEEGVLTVKFFASDRDAEIVITDLLGRTVKRVSVKGESKEYNTQILDVSDLPVGTYNLRLIGQERTHLFVIMN